MSKLEQAVINAAMAWAAAYKARWDGMQGKSEDPDPRIEANATLALFAAVEKLSTHRMTHDAAPASV